MSLPVINISDIPFKFADHIDILRIPIMEDFSLCLIPPDIEAKFLKMKVKTFQINRDEQRK